MTVLKSAYFSQALKSAVKITSKIIIIMISQFIVG